LVDDTKPDTNMREVNCFHRTENGTTVDLSHGEMNVYSGSDHVAPMPSYEFLDCDYTFTLEEICGDFGRDVIQRYSCGKPLKVNGITTLKFTNGCVNRCGYCKAGKVKPDERLLP
jgi:hypothetical protein